MRKLIGVLAAATLIVIAIFDVAKEGQAILGFGPVLILLSFGLVMWVLLVRLTRQLAGQNSGLPINLALWLHSFFEGSLAALSFQFGFKTGLIVVSALILHLLPEGLAVIAVLKQNGFSYRYALKTYSVSIVILTASLGLFSLIPLLANEIALTSLATIVAGGFIYLAGATSRRALQAN